MDYRTLDQGELEAQFNPRIAVADVESRLADYVSRSQIARGDLRHRIDIAYGDTPLQTLDVFPAARADAPLHVFIHGGYWRALDKSDHSFIAAPLVAAGATVVMLNYDLCPAVTLDAIVRQVRAGIAWVHGNAGQLGGDPNRLTISGHSAGAHLAVMAMHEDWKRAAGLPLDMIKAVVAVSGIYDLTPVLGISVNQDVRLTEPMMQANSPTLDPPPPSAPLLLAVGEDETPAWIQQTLDLHRRCEGRGVNSRLMRVPGRDHFSVALDMADADAPLFHAIRRHIGLT